MAMTMTGDIQLHANREAVWAKLNDPAVLKSCIPGCEQLDMLSDSEFQAVATVKVGPVKTRWKGKIPRLNEDPRSRWLTPGARWIRVWLMIRPGFLSAAQRAPLIAVARDGLVEHRVARRGDGSGLL